jgi:hypothetical protein
MHMKKAIFFTALLSLVASSAMAVDTMGRFGLGFVSTDTPVGIRYWFSEKIALDAGIGVFSEDQGDSSTTDFSVLVGLPINIMNMGDRVNFNFFPALGYAMFDVPDQSGLQSSQIDVIAGLEFEVFVTNDFSVSASHGVQFNIASYEDFGTTSVDSQTDWSTFGANITDFGLHYYFPK